MKVLALIGSGRKNGNTSRIVQEMKTCMERMAAEGGIRLEFETVFLVDEPLGACRGCRACMDLGEERCPVKDGFLALKAKMQAADGLLVASPVYVDDVSGLVKTWIDRLGHVNHRPEFAGKSAYAVATSGISPTGRTLGTLAQALTTWGYALAGKQGFITGAWTDTAGLRARYEQQIEQSARAFFLSIVRREHENPTFRSLLTFKIQQRYWQRAAKKNGVLETVDYRYWSGLGWLDGGVNYYIPHRAPRLKVALARLAGAALAPFVS